MLSAAPEMCTEWPPYPPARARIPAERPTQEQPTACPEAPALVSGRHLELEPGR